MTSIIVQIIDNLLIAAIILMTALLLLLSGCTTDVPRMTQLAPGRTLVQTDTRILGLKVATKPSIIESKTRQLDGLQLQKAKREQDIALAATARQSAGSFWFGLTMFTIAAACVIAGYICHGWKFWGGLSAVCAALATTAWIFNHIVHLLKYGAYGLIGVVLLWTMYKLRNFSLFGSLKASEPGRIFGKGGNHV